MGTLMAVTSSPRKTSPSEAGLRISLLVIALAPTQHISDFCELADHVHVTAMQLNFQFRTPALKGFGLSDALNGAWPD